MRILGIDPGLNHTGWGILEITPDNAVRLHWGSLHPPNGPLPQRLHALHQDLSTLIAQRRPDAVAVERPFQHQNVKTSVRLGQAQAAAMIAAAAHGLPVHEYPPRLIKEAVTGLGSAAKPAVKQALEARLGLAPLNASPDAADALAVAYCHHLMASPQSLPMVEQVQD